MDEDFFGRLDKYMQIKGLNDNQVTVNSGIPVGSLGKQRKGARGLSMNSIAKILHAYEDLNGDWLITGRGEMLRTAETKENSDKSDLYDRLESAWKDIGYYQRMLEDHGIPADSPPSKKGESA